MKHPGADALNAYVDRALSGTAREETERHLAGCDECRAHVETLRSLDAGLARSLTHDPGDAYFETFAARVEDRIRAEGLAGAGARPGWASWLASPRRLATAGAIAVVVVGAGLVVLVSREHPLQRLRAPATTDRTARLDTDRERSSALSAAEPAEETANREAKESDDAASRTSDLRDAQSARAYEVRRNEAGEEVPVRTDRGPGFAQPPASAPAPLAPGEGVRVTKPQSVEPMAAASGAGAAAAMQKSAAKPEAASGQQSADELRQLKAQTVAPATGAKRAIGATNEGAAQSLALDGPAVDLCGIVRDRAGRPVAGADVTVAETGTSVKSGADGRFCVRTTSGARTLTALALGFHETRQTVDAAKDRNEIALALEPVSVLGAPMPSLAGGVRAGRPEEQAYMLEAEDKFSVLPDAQRAIAREAQQAGARARDAMRGSEGARAAAEWDTSAEAWKRLLPQVKGDLEVATLHEISLARFQSWQQFATRAREVAAVDALRAFIARAPAGPDRLQAEERLRRLPR